MPAVVDTHRLIEDLKSTYGFTNKQAEGVTEAIKRIDLNHLSTKQDLRELELRLTIKLGSIVAAGVAFLAFLRFFGT